MRALLLRRLLALGAVLLGATALVALLVDAIPGDPAEIALRYATSGTDAQPTPEAVEATRRAFGLDAPAPVRWARWWACAAQGDFGSSFRTRTPIASELGARLLRSATLGVLAAFIAAALALPLGVAAARRPGGVLDTMVQSACAALAATPVFVLALVVVLVLSLEMRLLPAAGSETAAHYVLPALALGLAGAAVPAQVLRSQLLAEMKTPHAQAALARGLPNDILLGRHALRASAVPFATVLGLELRSLVGGAVVVEAAFGFRGLGSWFVQAVALRDLPVLQGCVAAFVASTGLVTLASDLACTALDPRLREAALA